MSRYENLYESQARSMPPDASIGDGDYAIVGDIELDVLVHAGLTPESSLLDFGCGTGRLAAWAVPHLGPGRYVGTDISPTMLEHARRLIDPLDRDAAFVHQAEYAFPANGRPYDMVCAFSVFTHMEPEDAFRYLLAARDVTADGATFVASVIPLGSSLGRTVFTAEAALPPEVRWTRVRNFATSLESFTELAALAGWSVNQWLDGETPTVPRRHGPAEPYRKLGQSVAVLTREQSAPAAPG